MLARMASRVPAITIQAILAGLRRLGFDERRLRAEARLPELPDARALVPDAMRQQLWAQAQRVAQREAIAVEAGLVLPIGALGAMDYLAISADTLGASCDALTRHFHSVSCERSLEIEQRPSDYRVKLIVPDARADTLLGDEFTLGAMVGRFRACVDGFSIAAVQLKRPSPANPQRFAELFGAPVSFGHAATALCLPGRARDLPISTCDPSLSRVLSSLLPPPAPGPSRSKLECSLRSHLRELLPRERFAASSVASALGMSERSLQRRLRELGRSYREIVDACRREEAERLLLEGRSDLAAIAHRLGFADQSGFSRAFKRWTHLAPRDWLAQHGPEHYGASPVPGADE
jgi:AraC-like DNA-binding protein